MTEEQKQSLIDTAKEDIHFLESVRERRGNLFDLEEHKLALMRIALAALTAPEDWKQRAEAAEAKLAELENNSLIDHLEKCSAIVAIWPEWKKKGSDATKFIQDLDEFEIGYLNGHIDACKSRPAPAADLSELVPGDKEFEESFKSWHPNRTGPYVKDQMKFIWEACRATILRNIEEANK